MEDFLNLHSINRSDVNCSKDSGNIKKDSKILNMESTSRKSVVGSKRSSKFVRSDALSPNSANKLLMETELGLFINNLSASLFKAIYAHTKLRDWNSMNKLVNLFSH